MQWFLYTELKKTCLAILCNKKVTRNTHSHRKVLKISNHNFWTKMEKAFENDRIYTGLTFSKKDKESRCDDKAVVVSVYVNDDKTTIFERRNRTRIVAISLTLFAIAIFILLYTMFVKNNASTNKGESRSKCANAPD